MKRLINRTGMSLEFILTFTARGLPHRKIGSQVVGENWGLGPGKVHGETYEDVDVYLGTFREVFANHSVSFYDDGTWGGHGNKWGYRVDTNAAEILHDAEGRVRLRCFTQKLFTNQSPCKIGVTLVIRKGADIGSQAGTKEFVLNSSQSEWHEFGSDRDIQLNGIKLAAVCEGSMKSFVDVVVKKDSNLDNQLNKSDGIDFGYRENAFFLSTRKVT